MMLYVNEGLKNTACSPTFTDVRDGIIQAAIDKLWWRRRLPSMGRLRELWSRHRRGERRSREYVADQRLSGARVLPRWAAHRESDSEKPTDLLDGRLRLDGGRRT